MIGFIGRLEEQKGSDILFEAIPKFIDQNVQIIALVSFMIPLFFSFSPHYLLLLPKKSYADECRPLLFRELAKNSWRSKLSS